MADSDRYDANVAVIEEYFAEEFPGCAVSSFRDHPVTITAAEVLTHTFKVDYLRADGVAGQMRGAATRSGWLLLKTTGTEERNR